MKRKHSSKIQVEPLDLRKGSQARSEEAEYMSSAKYLYYHFDLLMRSVWSLVEGRAKGRVCYSNLWHKGTSNGAQTKPPKARVNKTGETLWLSMQRSIQRHTPCKYYFKMKERAHDYCFRGSEDGAQGAVDWSGCARDTLYSLPHPGGLRQRGEFHTWR